MNQATQKDTKNNVYEAKFNTVEDDIAEFVFMDFAKNNEIEEELNNAFYWPKKNLPEEIEPGDEVLVSLNLKNREAKFKQIKERRQRELKQAEMRKMLEELIN